jgi:transketolase
MTTTYPATMRQAFADTVTDLLDTDQRVAVVLADISGDLFRSAASRHPERVINVGIREQLLVSVTGGLALTGLRPIAHTFPPFLVERALEQIKLDLNHQDVGAVLVSWGGSYDMSDNGRTHQSPGDVASLDTLPGWTIHVPGHPVEAAALLRDAIAGTGRVYVRLSSASNAEPLPTGAGIRIVRRGGRGVVLAVGPMLDRVLAATETVDVTVAYAATVRPLDGVGLRAAVLAADRPDVVLVEPYLADTSSYLVNKCLEDMPHRVRALGVSREFELRMYGSPSDHDTAHGLDAPGIAAAVRSFLGPGR